MPDVTHSSLTDPNLHEPKGASSAASGTWYIANGSGSGTWTKRLFTLTAALTPSEISANTSEEESFTLTGAVVATDLVASVIKPSHQAGLAVANVRVTADNTVAIQFVNVTGSPITPTAETYTFIMYRA
jgi:hypothetical protein